MTGAPEVLDSVRDAIGRTPLIRLRPLTRGALRPGGVVVEATSGNTGVGLAIAAAIKGYRRIFTIPDVLRRVAGIQ